MTVEAWSTSRLEVIEGSGVRYELQNLTACGSMRGSSRRAARIFPVQGLTGGGVIFVCLQ